MPKLNVVWKTRTHHIRRYANGQYVGFRLDTTGTGQSYRIHGSEAITESGTLEFAKAQCIGDLAEMKGRQKFFHELAPTPTHEVIEDGKVKAG